MLQFQGGELDIATSVPFNQLQSLQSNPDVQVVLDPVARIDFLALNTLRAPLDDPKVRQALNYGIDRKRFVENVILGEGITMSTPWRPNSPAFDPAKANAITFDLDKAKSLLTQAGITSLNLDMIYAPGNSEYQDLAAIYQADLAKVGIKLSLSTPDAAARLNAMQNQKLNGLYIANDTWAGMEPISFFTSSSIAGVRRNNGGFYSDKYTALVSAISAEPDANKRKVMYPELNDYLLDESFYMPITGNPGKIVTNARVKNIVARATDLFTVDAAWFE